jgi:hypothetical protein
VPSLGLGCLCVSQSPNLSFTFPSTFPAAALLVVPRESGETVSGVLVARDSGYLAIEIRFHGEPVADLEVQFFSATDGGERGDAIGDVVTTDTDGIARAARVVPAGLYVCAVENQDDLVVTTVAEFDDAYPVVLPVGRPHADLHDGLEFGDENEATSDDGDGDPDGEDGEGTKEQAGAGDGTDPDQDSAADPNGAPDEDDADDSGDADDAGGMWE